MEQHFFVTRRFEGLQKILLKKGIKRLRDRQSEQAYKDDAYFRWGRNLWGKKKKRKSDL